MNMGELKLQINSQVQLNNNWFVSKNDNQSKSFDNILKNATVDHSEVERGPSQKVDNSTMNKDAASINRNRSDFNDAVKELKEQIKTEIAKKKFQKENDISEDPVEAYDDLKEKLKALDASIKKQLAIPGDEEIDESVQAMTIDLSQLIELFTSEEVTNDAESIISSLVDQLVTQEMSVNELVDQLTTMVEDLPPADLKAVDDFINQLIEALPDSHVKKELVKLVEEKMPEIQVETKELKADVLTEVKAEEVKILDSKPKETVFTEKMNTPEAKLDQVKVKVEVETQTGSEKREPLLKQTTPVMTKEAPSIEDQIMMMKSESSAIQNVKETPKATLVRTVMNQVVQGVKMSVNMSDQGSEILIKLNPKNLGNVALKMAFEGEKLVAQIQVENQTVKNIVETNLDDLKNALKDSGYSVEGLEVSVSQDETDHKEQAFSNMFKGKRKQFIEDEEIIFEEKNLVTDKEIDYLA